MDFLILKEKEELLAKRGELTQKKVEVQDKLKDLSISKNNAFSYNKGTLREPVLAAIGEEKFITRQQLSKQVILLEKQLIPINTRLKEIFEIENRQKSSGKILKEILSEILSKDQMEIIYRELDNREAGGNPTKITLGIDNSVNQKQLADKYKKLAKESIDMVISVRKNLTSVIDAGCLKFDKGYFMQVISPLNRNIPPLSELDKIKRLNHLS